MLQSNSMEIKCLSSTIRAGKLAVSWSKDVRLRKECEETVYAVCAVTNDQTDFRERETHTGSPSPHRLSAKH